MVVTVDMGPAEVAVGLRACVEVDDGVDVALGNSVPKTALASEAMGSEGC